MNNPDLSKLLLTEFSEFSDTHQSRPYLCKEYRRMISATSETDILLLEARPGIGATSICAEYFIENKEPTIFLMAIAGSRMGYSAPFILEQALRQANNILEEEVSYRDDYGISDWHKALAKLKRKARASNQTVQIIIDGLYQIPSDDEKYSHDIIKDVLAIGNRDVKHIITWIDNQQIPTELSRSKIRRAVLPPLTDQESRSLLTKSGLSGHFVDDVLSAAQGLPAALNSIKRIYSIGKLNTNTLHQDLSHLYKTEWHAHLDHAGSHREKLRKAYAFLVFSKKSLHTKEVSELAELTPHLESILNNDSSFIKINKSGQISFSSNTHRNFLKNELSSFSSLILATFVERLAENISSDDSIQLLPNYFEDLGRHLEIVAALTTENLESYLTVTQSLTALRRRNELGFRAANKTKQDIDSYRFALQTSIVRAFETFNGNEARLAALTALGRLDSALDVAQSAATKEARLSFLSKYANILFKKKLTVDSVISETIRQLISEVDFSDNRDQALSIAESLIGPFPDLSIELVERNSEGIDAYKDAAFTHLALRTQVMPGNASYNAERYTVRVINTTLQDFLRATEAVFQEKSVEEVKRCVAALDSSHRPFIVRHWLKAHKANSDALELANYGLDEVLRNPAYLPTAEELRDFCSPITEAKDELEARELLERIEAQRAALLDVTATVDRFRLDIEIALAKSRLNPRISEDLVTDLYVKASDEKDDGIRLECFSWLQAALDVFSNSLTNENKLSLNIALNTSIEENIQKCLESTAEHIEVFKGSISALVEHDPEAAFRLIEKINTEERRETAYAFLIEKLILRRSPNKTPIALILKALGKIEDGNTKCQATVTCMRLLAQTKSNLDAPPTQILAISATLPDPLARAHCLRWALPVSKNYGISINLIEKWNLFKETTSTIDQAWRNSEVTYRFIEAAAQIDQKTADELLKEYEHEIYQHPTINSELAQLITALARLTIVALDGVAMCKLESDDEFKSTIAIINEVPSLMRRMELLSDIGLRCYKRRKIEWLDQVCELITKSISSCPPNAENTKEALIELAFPSLFLWKESYANDIVKKIPSRRKDVCILQLIDFFIQNSPLSEPFQDQELSSAHLKYHEAISIVTLIERIEGDAALGYVMEDFVSALLSKGSTYQINYQQRCEIAHRLLQKIQNTLPQAKNIKHQGWLIFCQTQCFRIIKETSNEKWNELIAKSREIPNISDSVFVLSSIATHLPPKLSSIKTNLLDEAENLLVRIPSSIDRVRRRIALSKCSNTSEGEIVFAKKLLSNAMKESLQIKDERDASEARKQIIDTAYALDESFATDLTRSMDRDPARGKARSEVEERLEAQKHKSAISKSQYSEITGPISDLGRISWELLGSLNARKIGARKIEEISPLFTNASRQDIFESMGFYWWFLRNCQYKYEHSLNQAKVTLLPLFEVTRLAAMLSLRIGGRLNGTETKHFAQNSTSSNGIIVSPGERNNAIDFILNWADSVNGEEFILCDPYFSPNDIELIKDISFRKGGANFTVLSCKEEIKTSVSDLEIAYKSAWSKIAHVELPSLRIIHISYESEKTNTPIHDRWLICEKSGLRLGTSVNSIGINKLSEVSPIDSESIENITEKLRPFIELRKTINDRRISYKMIDF